MLEAPLKPPAKVSIQMRFFLNFLSFFKDITCSKSAQARTGPIFESIEELAGDERFREMFELAYTVLRFAQHSYRKNQACSIWSPL